jgi:hypothetical protein
MESYGGPSRPELSGGISLEPMQFAHGVIASTMALGGVFLAFVLIRGRLGAMRRRALFSGSPRALTDAERQHLQRWQARTLTWFSLTMAALALYTLSFAGAPWLPSLTYVLGSVLVVALGASGLAIHLAARCPVCGWRIGYQSTLLLPSACEVCGAVFRPGAIWALASGTGARGPVRVVSKTRVLGVPLFNVAFGVDPATGQTRGVARGLVAVGDVAIGVVAVGGVAVGVLPVGGVSIGLLAVGGLSLGVAAVGGAAMGGVAVGGIALGVYAAGGLVAGPHVLGGLALPMAGMARTGTPLSP